MRYTTRDLESGQASINCDPQTAYNRLAYLEDWWELYIESNCPNGESDTRGEDND